jgi:hypothetical protein
VEDLLCREFTPAAIFKPFFADLIPSDVKIPDFLQDILEALTCIDEYRPQT